MSKPLCLLVLLLTSSAWAAQKPTNLDELLEQVKRDEVLEQQQNKLREAEFVKAHAQQSQLLKRARKQLAIHEKRTSQLQQDFQQLEEKLAKQQMLLEEKSGSFGELFGTVKLVANDGLAVLQGSMISVNKADRIEMLSRLAQSKQQPSIQELRQLWLSLQEEMTDSGKVEQFTAPVISVSGELEQKTVTRIGVFTAFADDHFLRYLPETGNLVELVRQPAQRLRDVAAAHAGAQAGDLMPAVVDPTRGAIMALLVQTPTLQERIRQGGWIGFIILGLGAVGFLLALLRFISLTLIGQGVVKQQNQQQVSRDNPLGRILAVYSDKLAEDVETLSLKLDEAILREVPKLERGLVTLAILAAVSPMLGLLGTVSGMIDTFQSITLFGTSDPKLMSGGISQALVTTNLGLAVAIPLLLIHSVLSSKSNRLIQILDEESAAIIARHAEKHHGRTD